MNTPQFFFRPTTVAELIGLYIYIQVRFFWARFVNAIMNYREFAMFAVIVFVGMLIGGWIITAIGIAGSSNIFYQLIAYLIPVLVVYLLWKRFGRKAQAQ